MKWICFCAAMLLLGGTSALWADNNLAPTNGAAIDPWTDNMVPSGLRFAEVTPTVKTGSYGGGGAYGGTGACGCATGGPCIHWSLLPWYAPWPTAHDYYRYERRANRCYGTPGYY